jgi:hypothetical protein
MKRNLISLNLLLWIGLLQPDGFAERTLVMGQYGLKHIEQFKIGNHVVVIAAGGELQPYSISHTMSYVADSFIKIQIKDVCVCAAPNQKFYSCDRNDWVSAQALNISERLLCGNGKTVCIDAIETVHKKQKMHAFSVDTSHIFCVTPYQIIAHNIDPATTATVLALSAVCPPAAIVQVAAVSIVGCVMFCLHRRSERNRIKYDRCFSTDNIVNNSQPVGCYHPVPNCPLVCDIKAGKEIETVKITPYINPEVAVNNVGCEFPIAEIEKPILHNAATQQSDCDENKRYDGPWYHRTEDWVKEFEQKGKLERSIYVNQGKRAFAVLENIKGCDGLKKGHYVVVDALHNDHLEVFGKDLEWKHVANFDGTLNDKKTEQGREETRRPLQRG